jgi:hypothetical protein
VVGADVQRCGDWTVCVHGRLVREGALDGDGKIDIFNVRVLKDFKYPKALHVLPGEVVEG